MSDIYLVDDHALMRDGLRVVLEHGGHRVVGEAGDVAQALSDIPRLTPCVVLLDLNLGERSGMELLERLPLLTPFTHYIVLTMLAQPGHVAEAFRLGACGYVLKGSPAAEVLLAVDEVRRGNRHLGPGVKELANRALADTNPGGILGLLSARERQIIAMVVRGRSSAAIGDQLHLSPKTVDTYRSRIMAKLDVSDVPALVRLAIREGLISAEEM
jgi:two-component system, NarL family, invasion response regulator UvrY